MVRTLHTATRVAFILLLTGAAGCATSGEPTASSASNLVGGTETEGYPFVGVIAGFGSRCGATLITPSVAVTAGHCVEFKVCGEPNCALHRTLTLELDGQEVRRDVVRIHSFMYYFTALASTSILRRDVAVVEVAEPFPTELVTPTTIAPGYPELGSSTYVVGFGCTSRCDPEPYEEGVAPPKQVVEVTYGDYSGISCLGDSGGPTLDGEGRVVRVTSASRVKYGDDIFGDVVALGDEIAAVIAQWEAEPWTEEGDNGMCITRHDCESCTSRNACGWCANTGRCYYGDWEGPADDPTVCGGSDWIWGRPECPGLAWRPEEEIEPWDGDCAVGTDCGSCTRLPMCGWIPGTQTCAWGMPWGPDDANLPGADEWLYLPYCCPVDGTEACGDDACNGHETCMTCEPDCGPCEPRCGDLRCQEGEDPTTCPEDCRAPGPDTVSREDAGTTDVAVVPDGAVPGDDAHDAGQDETSDAPGPGVPDAGGEPDVGAEGGSPGSGCAAGAPASRAPLGLLATLLLLLAWRQRTTA